MALLLGLTLSAGADTRFHQFTAKYRQTPDQAPVISAGCLGGEGTEWFSGGGFLPDGTVVTAGTALGPTLTFPVPVAIIGKDAPPPMAFEPEPLKDKKGIAQTTKEGAPKFQKFAWTHPNATGFIVLYSPDLKTVKAAARFPWKSAGITDAAVDQAGNIYVTGPATDAIGQLGGEVLELPVGDTGTTKGDTSHIYLARLTQDATKAVWVRHMKSPSIAPSLSIGKDGKLRLQGPDIRTFDASGKLEFTTLIPGGLGSRVAINPVDGTYARYGERHSPTGREPYRNPILNIFRPDGTWLYELYNWTGPFVGLDNLRLVSDSAVRIARYDAQGNLLISAWSDGGNSVMLREPNDIRTGAKAYGGLGFSAWGAGVLSSAYLIKIETKNYKVAGGAQLLAFLRDQNKPNSLWVDAMGLAADGSICVGGRSARGLIQTGNHIGGIPEDAPSEPAGNFISVLSSDGTSLRFSSALPATAGIDLGNGEEWGIVSGVVGGRTRVLFLSGAMPEADVYGMKLPPPNVNGAQPKYGGGFHDAYAVLLDLGPATSATGGQQK